MLDIERHYRTAHTAVCWFWCCMMKQLQDTTMVITMIAGQPTAALGIINYFLADGTKIILQEINYVYTTIITIAIVLVAVVDFNASGRANASGRTSTSASAATPPAITAASCHREVRPVAIPLVVASPLADPQCHALGEDGDVATQRRRQLARHRDAKTSMGVGVGMDMGMGMGVVGVGVGMSVSMGMSMSMGMGVLT
jgi:hypothetical protein